MMQTQRIDEKLSFLHMDAHPARQTVRQTTGQTAGQNTKTAPTILSRAAEVYISAKGRELSATDAPDDRLTPAETALAAEQNELDEKRAKKDEAAAIEQRIATDEKLTDDDKALLQKEADKLKRAGMTDEDWLSTFYKKGRELERQYNAEGLTREDKRLIDTRITENKKTSVSSKISSRKKQSIPMPCGVSPCRSAPISKPRRQRKRKTLPPRRTLRRRTPSPPSLPH